MICEYCGNGLNIGFMCLNCGAIFSMSGDSIETVIYPSRRRKEAHDGSKERI